jgi:hypothetical protein
MGLTPADFGRDPNAAFVNILRDAREPLTARKVIDAVAERGIPRATVSAKWKTFQEKVVKFHPQIDRPNASAYRWLAEPVASDEALTRLVALLATKDKIKAPLRDALVTVIRSSPGKTGTDDDSKVRAARERQFKLDALHAVAELAGEVEELAYDSGDADLIVERLRARVRASALEQLGQPGDEAKFDPARHEVQGTRPAEGAAVTVVRPGYASAEGGTPLVLRKALVVAD